MPSIRLCWADRLALGAFFFVCLIFSFPYILGAQDVHSDNLVVVFATLGVKVILPVWILLRIIDLVSGGPERRRSRGISLHLR